MHSFTIILRSTLPFLLFLGFSYTELLSQSELCAIRITAIEGTATTKDGTAFVGMTLEKGSIIRTDDNSHVTLTLGEGAILKLSPHSKLSVEVAYCPDSLSRSIRLKLDSGSLWTTGHPSLPKYEVATEQCLAVVGLSSLSLYARYVDTMIVRTTETQEISTRDWSDTVDVMQYNLPFQGELTTIRAHKGNVMLIPWGKRGSMLKKGRQQTLGAKEELISSKAVRIKKKESQYDAEGNYLLEN